MDNDRKYKIVYCTPALYMAGGVERVQTLKANYFADHFGYDITIILTEGKDKPIFYPLSEKIKVINLDINFEELWYCSFVKKIFVYLRKQRLYKKRLTEELMRIRPDITVSMLRREINFITSINDGSRKIGELHVNRANYRNFKGYNPVKLVFGWFWMRSLVSKLRRLDCLAVLTEKDKAAWPELSNVVAIPNPLFEKTATADVLKSKRILAISRYSHEKGIDLLLTAWAMAQNANMEWSLDVFGEGDRTQYDQLMEELNIDRNRCHLNGRTADVQKEYINSSFSVCSSRFEGFGMAIVEAMACGLPVVSFDCPWGPRSIISDGEDGILVDNGNVVKLAAALSRLINDDELRQKMANAARGNSSWFQLDYIAQMWKALFDNIMKK